MWHNRRGICANSAHMNFRTEKPPANMTLPSPQQTKLLTLLRELFQLDQPDLDFGLYRIMHAKAREIEHFLEHDLLDTIREKMGGNKTEKIAQARLAYEKERQNAIDYGGNPDSVPKVQQALAEYKAAQEGQDDDAELFDHLYRFFERYYEGGDFLTRRYYARETSEKASPYAVPYDGSEVYLHWANKDQYYIKTTESFRQFSVDLAQVRTGDGQLFSGNAPRKLHFSVVEAEEGAHNNVKATGDKERYFILDTGAPLAWQGDELTLRFHYRADPDKTGQAGKWREARNAKNAQGILEALAQQSQGTDAQAQLAQHFHQALAAEVPRGKSGDTQALLAKYLNQFTARNSMDYFIHKGLGGFLKRELDFYIKNELFRLDDLGNADAPNPQQYDKLLKKALTLREVAHKLIVFLAQTEDFQKKLWLKKKFVVDTQWLVTLDKVPASLYPQIESNDAQWAEWAVLGFVAADAGRGELLKPESRLVLDTRFYDAAFTAQLLASIDNLDDATDGVLVHSENFQALNLMQARYRQQVKCIYIDPPYNAQSSEILYKNNYKHSSWLSLIQDRILCSRALFSQSFVQVVAIDEVENLRLGMLFVELHPECEDACISVVHNPTGQQGNNFSFTHEFAHFVYPRNINCIGLENRDDPLRESQPDIRPLRNVSSGKDHLRTSAANCFYPIFIKDGVIHGFGDVCDDDFHPNGINVIRDDGIVEVYPIDPAGVESKWVFARNTVESILGELTAKFDSKKKIWDIIRRKANFRYKSLWEDKRYSANSWGSVILNNMLPGNPFTYPKSIYTVRDCIDAGLNNSSDGLTLDYFAGSGTTGHAVINLNREDKGKRKYILVEMGDYFDTVLKPRIAKVVYSAEWKEGKPTSPGTGISQLVKVIRLESYEDTLNNLLVAEESAQRKVIEANPALRERYFLHYLLELETQDSPSLLNISVFTDPTAYTLDIKKPGSDSQERRAVDLVETFTWLLGLRVSKLHAPQTFTADFTQEADPDLPGDTPQRMVLSGGLEEITPSPPVHPPEGEGRKEWWFRAVQGVVQGKRVSGHGERVLVVWRKLTGNLEQDNLVLEAYLREALGLDVRRAQDAVPFDAVYVNGSHALPAMPLCEVRQLEEVFHHLMWDVQDA